MIDKFSIFKGKRRLHFALLTKVLKLTELQKQRANKFYNFWLPLKKLNFGGKTKIFVLKPTKTKK